MAELTHWKKLHNPDYLGAYSLDAGGTYKDLVATIKNVKMEEVTGSDGKKEQCMVMRFVENGIKPMIVNATNAKTLTKLFGTPYIENWAGRKIQLFVDKVKAFGDVVEALRIRNYAPKVTGASTTCSKCNAEIEGVGNKNAQQIADYTARNYGRPLCSKCATAESAKAQVEQPVNDPLKEPDVPAETETPAEEPNQENGTNENEGDNENAID
jgi:hypothetical protein